MCFLRQLTETFVEDLINHLIVYKYLYRDEFRTQLNIYNRAFLQRKTVNDYEPLTIPLKKLYHRYLTGS